MKRVSAIWSVERQDRLARLVQLRKRITVAEVCREFHVCLATARRDLDAIAEQGRVQRVHGGAVAPAEAPPEGPALERASDQADEKRRIGKAAAELVGSSETVVIGTGTTALEAARNLVDRRDLTVITNSLLVVNLLSESTDINVICLGGMLRRSEMSLIGHIAEQALSEVRANKVIMGIRAIDVEQGLTNDYLPEAASDRVILKSGRQVILVADHTKCGRVATGFVGPLEAVHTLVTDARVPGSFISAVKKHGVNVITV
ncbi:MAG TPA: DeoR/GlpR family DNA-binding transcription regulator [Polyangiaceae bacterium]|jgi:DeoR/GlpR family transcriptional regulator of sugar metabolism